MLPIGAILRRDLPIAKPRQKHHVPTPAVRTRHQDLASVSDSDDDGDSDSDDELMLIPVSSIVSPDSADTTAEGPPGDEVDSDVGVSAGRWEEDSVDAVQEEQVDEVVNTAEILRSSPKQIADVDILQKRH